MHIYRIALTLALLLLAVRPVAGQCVGVTVPAVTTNLQAIVDANPAGTTYCLETGTLRLAAPVTPKNGDTFQGVAGTVISGARVLTGWTVSGATWYVTGQTQLGQIHGECVSGYPRCDRPEDLYMDNVLKLHVATLGEVTAGEWFFDYAADRIYVGDDPAGKTVETNVISKAFGGSASTVTIQTMAIEKFASPAQNGAIDGTSTTGWTITNVDARYNHGYGIRIGNSMTVQTSRVNYNGQIGIGGVGNSVQILTNEIAYNNTTGFNPGWEAGGTKFALTNGLIVRANNVHHNIGPGLWTDIDNINTLYEDNLVEDNTQMGIFHEISYAAIIRNNTVRRNAVGAVDWWLYGAGILVSASKDVEVYGNTVEDNYNGITAVMQNRGSGIYGLRRVENLHVHDNTVTQRTVYAAGFGEDIGDPSYCTSKNNRWVNNDYFLGTAAAHPAPFAWCTGARTPAQWQSPDGQDLTGTFSRAVTIVATSCSQAHVTAAIASAVDLDTVIIPNGSCSWTSSAISISGKAITVQAQTSRGVIIAKDNSPSAHLFDITESTVRSVVIRGLKFVGGSGDGFGTAAAIRVGYTAGGYPVVIYGNEWNDEVAGILSRTKGMLVYGNLGSMTPGSDMQFFQCKRLEAAPNNGGLDDWQTASTMGTLDTTGYNNAYLENNELIYYKNQGIDSDGGCRLVVRYNLFNNSTVNGHGPDTGQPPLGNRHIEIYNNTFETHYPSPDPNCSTLPPAPMNWYIFQRGGTMVIYGNALPNLGNCATGFKSNIQFQAQALRRISTVYPVQCWSSGYPLVRQLGQGHNGVAYVPDPIYIWGNTGGTDWQTPGRVNYATPGECDVPTSGACPNCPNGNPDITVFVQLNRDYIIGTAKPGYAAFTYPHPLRSLVGPTPPTGLVVPVLAPQMRRRRPLQENR